MPVTVVESYTEVTGVDFSLFPKDSHFNVFFIMSFKMHTLIDMHCTGEPAYMT